VIHVLLAPADRVRRELDSARKLAALFESIYRHTREAGDRDDLRHSEHDHAGNSCRARSSRLPSRWLGHPGPTPNRLHGKFDPSHECKYRKESDSCVASGPGIVIRVPRFATTCNAPRRLASTFRNTTCGMPRALPLRASRERADHREPSFIRWEKAR
jgi:hypothetical protein